MHFSALASYAQHQLGIDPATLKVVAEEQNSDYESGIVVLGAETWHVRTGRVTPKKPGAFVAFWTRDEGGETRPFTREEVGEGLLVFAQHDGREGVFRFDAVTLERLGVTGAGKSEGKRGFRVYPPWCDGLNPRAAKTQGQQASSFREWSRG